MKPVPLRQTRFAAVAGLVLLGMLFIPAGTPDCSGEEKVPLLGDAGFSAGDLKPLTGRWLRPDGGYVLDIRSAAPDGKLEAYYYNPKPINVHRAQVSLVKTDLKLVVELRDAGYPGSTYALLYRPDRDILAGYYFQAGRKQYFEVLFVRQKK